MPESEKESVLGSIIERRGFFYPAFDIYNGVGGFYNYGGVGLRIKRNMENVWRALFVDEIGATEIETTTIMPEVVFKASGHVSTFTDPMIVCGACKTAFRADKLLEQYYEKKNDQKSLAAVKRLGKEAMEKRINEFGIKCERCGGALSKVESFNLMFKTHIGPKADETAYLRPESAQGIFVDFKRVYRLYSLKLPALISQVGRAYRNEISPRQQLVRQREFTQMDTEIFFDPENEESVEGIGWEEVLNKEISFVHSESNDESRKTLEELLRTKTLPNRYFALLLYMQERLMGELGIDGKLYRFRELEKEELPHYSKTNIDLEVRTSYGYIEIAGNADRGDYDLSQHAKFSGEEMAVLSDGKKVVPHIIEATLGLDRLFFATLDASMQEGDKRGWKWLKLNENIAPYKYAVFALQKDERLTAKAREIFGIVKDRHVSTYYSETGSIGKRYARADEIGVPFAITCDYQTLEDGTVTIRSRDTTKQIRKGIDEI